jgi:hypothetical protein
MKIKFVGASGGQEQICMKEREGAGAEGYKGATGASKVIANASFALSKFSESFVGHPEPRHHQQHICWLCMNLFQAQPTGRLHCENLPAHAQSSSRLWLRAHIKFASGVLRWCEMG